MAKNAGKKAEEMSKEELAAELTAQRERSDRLQADAEARQKKDDDAKRAEDARRNQNEPSEEQWVALEEKYGASRDEIKRSWRIASDANRPLLAELQGFKLRDAATEAVRVAKATALSEDPQFPKYEKHVEEFLSDVPLQDRADPEKLKKHMDRAVHYAKGKARADGSHRDGQEDDRIRDGGHEKTDDEKAGFGKMEISGIPLTINVEKRVPDDFRKLHSHPEKEGAVRMNEKARWDAGVPQKPR